MKVAAFQFHGSDDVKENLLAIERGIEKGSKAGVRLLMTQECAICGYPPVETNKVSSIDFGTIANAVERIKELAIKNDMYIGLRTIIPDDGKYFNSIALISVKQENPAPYSKRAANSEWTCQSQRVSKPIWKNSPREANTKIQLRSQS